MGGMRILTVPGATNQAVCACTPFSGVWNRYLFAFLLASRRAFSAAGAGGAQPNISKVKIIHTPFPVPPPREQHRIVAKVDTLLDLLDRLEAARDAREVTRTALRDSSLAALRDADTPEEVEEAWERVAEHMEDLITDPADVDPLRQTVLQLAVRGRLVPQDPDDEPASMLLGAIAEERSRLVKEGKVKKPKKLPLLSEVGVPFDPPNGWVYCRVQDTCEIGSGVTKGRKLGNRQTSTYPYLRVANVQAGFLRLDVVKEIEIPVEEFERYSLRPGDVLLTEGGDWDKLGRSAIWTGEIPVCLHQNHVFRARPLRPDLIGSRWLSMFTNSPDGRAYFQSCSKQTTNLASINKTQLRSCPIPIPPSGEQHRIVAKVDELMGLLDRLEQRLADRANTHNALAAAVVHHLDA